MRLFVVVMVAFAASSGKPATAGVVYDFALPANGSVGALDIKITLPGFAPPDGSLNVFGLNDPSVTYTSGTPLDPTNSFVGFTVTPTATLIGLALFDVNGDEVLANPIFPDDFFSFTRDPLQIGSTSSSSGNVFSGFPLDTGSPIATLTVSVVPEPSSLALVGLGSAIGLGGLARRRRLARS